MTPESAAQRARMLEEQAWAPITRHYREANLAKQYEEKYSSALRSVEQENSDLIDDYNEVVDKYNNLLEQKRNLSKQLSETKRAWNELHDEYNNAVTRAINLTKENEELKESYQKLLNEYNLVNLSNFWMNFEFLYTLQEIKMQLPEDEAKSLLQKIENSREEFFKRFPSHTPEVIRILTEMFNSHSLHENVYNEEINERLGFN